MIASFDSKTETSDAGSKIEFTTISCCGKWFKTNAKYSEPLTFSFSIAKSLCIPDNEKYFTREDISFIMRWLVRNEYCYIHFLQDGFEDIYYNCRLQVVERVVGGQIIGFDVEGVCDAPFGYGSEMELHFYDSQNVQKIYDSSDEIGQTYPYMEIVCASDGTIEIENVDTGAITSILNCITGEKIIIGQDFQITTDNLSHNIADDFNYIFFCFGNTLTNRISYI